MQQITTEDVRWNTTEDYQGVRILFVPNEPPSCNFRRREFQFRGELSPVNTYHVRYLPMNYSQIYKGEAVTSGHLQE
jgi:hypothetical protein